MKQSISPVLIQYIKNRSVEILGLGVSNLPLAELLCEAGIPLTVRDKKAPEELGESALRLREKGVRFFSGEDCFDHVDGDLIFRSPGIRPDLPALTRALRRGAELTSEIELFLRLSPAQSYALTGSDGKTTSTTLTERFLAAEAERTGVGKALVGGNIGTPLLYRLAETSENDRVAMELFSFQLMTVTDAPAYAAITNLSPNHLDWHTSMDEYANAKKKIVGKETKRLVTNADCAATVDIAAELLGKRKENGASTPALYLFSSTRTSFEEIFSGALSHVAEHDRALYLKDGQIVLSDGLTETALLSLHRIRVPGKHNAENFMTAIALTYGRVDPSVYGSVADAFTGVEHRLEWVRNLDGVDYYNSSIDSSPTRTAAALSALAGRDIVVICGGYDKKIPFEPLADALLHSARAVVLTGATAEKIGEAIRNHPLYESKELTVCFRPDFKEAIQAARSLAREGGCVLLSPACASFDAFRNFAERGDRFRSIVKSLES